MSGEQLQTMVKVHLDLEAPGSAALASLRRQPALLAMTHWLWSVGYRGMTARFAHFEKCAVVCVLGARTGPVGRCLKTDIHSQHVALFSRRTVLFLFSKTCCVFSVFVCTPQLCASLGLRKETVCLFQFVNTWSTFASRRLRGLSEPFERFSCSAAMRCDSLQDELDEESVDFQPPPASQKDIVFIADEILAISDDAAC